MSGIGARLRKALARAFDSLDEIPLTEEAQGTIHRELLNWTKQSAQLFSAVPRVLFTVGKQQNQAPPVFNHQAATGTGGETQYGRTPE